MVSRNQLLSVLLVIANSAAAPVIAVANEQATDQEIDKAEHILQQLMVEGDDEDEPVLHELLADVYSARGMRDRAAAEHERSRTLAKERTVKYLCETVAAVNQLRDLFGAAMSKQRTSPVD